MECIFCRIIKGLEKAYFVYRDNIVVAFLDKFPVARGHTLVVTREHFKNILDVPEEALERVTRVAKWVSIAQVRELGARAIKLVMNNGRLAGQEIMHLHIHVIPFYTTAQHRRTYLRDKEGEEISRALRRYISSFLVTSKDVVETG